MNMDSAPTAGFEKLQFLLQQSECPPETFGNLLLLYVKHQYYDQAADVMAENTHLTFKCVLLLSSPDYLLFGDLKPIYILTNIFLSFIFFF